MFSGDVHFRLLRADDLPATNPHGLAFRFGLQDSKGVVHPGTQLADGSFQFDFTLSVKPGKAEQPVFTGRYAHGPADDRFVYLSWLAVDRGDWINRVKAPLAPLTWELIQVSREQGKPITADLSGRKPGGGRAPITWFLS